MRVRSLSRQNKITEHLAPASISMTVATMVVWFMIYDRMEPFEYVKTEITPQVASPGEAITVHRHVIWRRQCEGWAFTEIVDGARIVTIYDVGVRYPAVLGETAADRRIELPVAMHSGQATYRGVIRFKSCGWTSRWWPLEVEYQPTTFNVR